MWTPLAQTILIFFFKKMYQNKNMCVIPKRGLQASYAKLLKTKDYASPTLPSAAVFSSRRRKNSN
jgi:hypothetical protein